MPLTKKRLVLGAVAVISLTVVAMLLRLGLEWRQALTDINAMIVTPVSLPELDVDLQGGAMSPQQQTAEALGTPGPTSAALAAATPAPAPTARPDTWSDDGTVTILLLGTDQRPKDVEPPRTDALVLVHLNRATGHVSLVSLPRDLWVKYPRFNEGRINAAYAVGEKRLGPGGGAALAKATVSQLLGVKVDYFLLINFQGFRTLIDRLDGIVVDVPKPIDDPAYPTEDRKTMAIHFDAGTQVMDGEHALMYARTRHADSDFGRIQRQQQVLMAIFDRVRERGVLQQLTSVDDYTAAMRDYVRTDMGRGVMFDLAVWGRNLHADNIERFAIDSKMIYNLKPPATFAADPAAIKTLMAQVTAASGNAAGGE